MKRKYIKPELTVSIMGITPILNASFGDGNADPDQEVLSKQYNCSVWDDIDNE